MTATKTTATNINPKGNKFIMDIDLVEVNKIVCMNIHLQGIKFYFYKLMSKNLIYINV